MPWFRVDLHNHCSCDRFDALDYSAADLIRTAHRRGIHALAITPHRDVFHDPEAETLARSLGMLLIPGVEKLISGREVVLLNVRPNDVPRRMDWADLRRLRASRGESLLVLAPHPFYPRPNCVGPDLTMHADCIDAVEWCHFYGFGFNPNRTAATWASQNNKPLIATSDAHHLLQAGRNIQEVDAPELTIPALFAAIRASRVRRQVRPYSATDLFHFATQIALPHAFRKLRRLIRPENLSGQRE
jgi:predicted metal-dependent phosphoesterase TrpH